MNVIDGSQLQLQHCADMHEMHVAHYMPELVE
jgi:hypothetical protein